MTDQFITATGNTSLIQPSGNGGDGLHATGGRGGGKGGVFEAGDPGGVAIEATGDVVIHGRIKLDSGQLEGSCPPPPPLPAWAYDAPSGMIGAFALTVLFALVLLILKTKAK